MFEIFVVLISLPITDVYLHFFEVQGFNHTKYSKVVLALFNEKEQHLQRKHCLRFWMPSPVRWSARDARLFQGPPHYSGPPTARTAYTGYSWLSAVNQNICCKLSQIHIHCKQNLLHFSYKLTLHTPKSLTCICIDINHLTMKTACSFLIKHEKI